MDYRTTAAGRDVIGDIPVFCRYDELLEIDRLKPNPKNPNRHPDKQIRMLAEVIRGNGWRAVITVSTRSGMIVRGHGRFMAAKLLGQSRVPVEYQDYGSEAEELADMAADNKIQELSELDVAAMADLEALIRDQVPLELAGLEPLAVEKKEHFWDGQEDAADPDEDDPEYREFVDKFKPKKTTDDCYTPPLVYDAIRNWACKEYGIDPDKIVRPFYPGGDYQGYQYPEGCVVLDNPPFSILSEICSFYLERDISFFLFAPALTMFGGNNFMRMCHILCDGAITYENGATVRTGFVTSFDTGIVARTAPELTEAIDDASNKIRAKTQEKYQRYTYPAHVLTPSRLNKLSSFGLDLRISADSCVHISCLDAQKKIGSTIYGDGLLLSEKAAAENAAAEKAAATVWELSEREWEIIRGLK